MRSLQDHLKGSGATGPGQLARRITLLYGLGVSRSEIAQSDELSTDSFGFRCPVAWTQAKRLIVTGLIAALESAGNTSMRAYPWRS